MLPKYNIVNFKKATEPAIELVLNLPKPLKLLEELLALPNIVELTLNVEEGFGELPELIKQAHNLKNLRIENLKKYPENVLIPEVLLNLGQIENMQIIDCPNLVFGNSSWAGLSNLNGLYLYNTASTFPTGMTKALNLRSISISKCKFEIPESFSELKNLEIISISQDTPAPIALKYLPKLESLSIFCSDLPDWIGDCSKTMQSLSVYANIEKELVPENVYEYPFLEKLQLWRCGIKTLSPKISQLKKLKSLQLGRNKLTSLPIELASMDHLEELDIEYNPFSGTPSLLALMPWLKNSKISGTALHDSEIARFKKFLDWLTKSSYTQTDRAFFVQIWDKADFKPQREDLNNLSAALLSKIDPLNSHALYYLTEVCDSAYRPLKKGDILFVDAKLSNKISEIKEKLKALEISVATKYSETVTHVLIDLKSNLNYNGASLMTEQQLISYLNELKPDYLVESAQQDDSMVEQVNALLFSMDDDNVEIAFGLLKGGGIPTVVMTALFTVYKFSDNKNICSKALKLLQQAASPELLSALKTRTDFKKTNSRYKFNSNISIFSGTEIDLIRFSIAFSRFKNASYSEEYILKNANQKDLREYCELISKEGTLNLNLSYYGIIDVPEFVYEFTHLTKLRLVTVTKVAQEDLKSIEKLVALEVLELDDSLHKIGMFAMPFLKSLSKLPKLKSIRIYGMSQETKAFLKANLPNCSLRS